MLNILTMASEHHDMSSSFLDFIRVSNYIFTGIFIVESSLKFIAFGPYRFHFGQMAGWNNFDLFIVFISVAGIYFDESGTELPLNPTVLRILRILRVARILKLLKSAKDLMLLLQTVTNSLVQVGNLALLLFLLFFIYAALGMELFGYLDCTDANPCDGFSEFANFDHFGHAMLILFRLTTGDNWNGLMKDGMRTSPDSLYHNNVTVNGALVACSLSVDCMENCCGGCDPDAECKENCCSSVVGAALYFCSFILLAQFVMLNLVVAVLMQELENSEDANELAAQKTRLAALMAENLEAKKNHGPRPILTAEQQEQSETVKAALAIDDEFQKAKSVAGKVVLMALTDIQAEEDVKFQGHPPI